MRGLQDPKGALQGVFFHVLLVRGPWTMIQAVTMVGIIHPKISMLGSHGEEWQDEGC